MSQRLTPILPADSLCAPQAAGIAITGLRGDGDPAAQRLANAAASGERDPATRLDPSESAASPRRRESNRKTVRSRRTCPIV
jgi:hypothetical protein